MVSQDYQAKAPVSQLLSLDEARAVVHPKDDGLIKVLQVITPEGDRPHRATHDLQMMGLQRLSLAKRTWVIEKYHQGGKPFCGIERYQIRVPTA